MRHLVAETAVQLKVRQKRGVVVDMFDSFSCVVFEVLEYEKYVANTSGRIVRLSFGGERWIKDFLGLWFISIAM